MSVSSANCLPMAMNDMHSSHKKRLLFVNGHLNVGGVEKSLVDLLRHLDYTKYDVDLLLLQDLGDYYSELPTDVKVIYRDVNHVYGPFLHSIWSNMLKGRFADIFFRFILLFSALFTKRIFRLLRPLLGIAKQYDTAIAYRTGFCEDLVAYAVKSKKKVLWWHHGECNYTPNQIAQANKTWPYFDHVVTVSKGCKEMLENTFNYPKERYAVIPNLIDIEKIKKLAGSTNPYNIDRGIQKFVTVGRLSEEKHVENAVYATRILIDKGYTNFRWYIVGDGELHDFIAQLIIDQNVSEHVLMLGKIVNPYPYIKYADILIHTSYVESQSITVLEAMALHTPCVVCESVGPKEFMQNGENGILVGHSTEDLATGIKALNDYLHINVMKENAFQTVNRLFSSDTIIGKLEGMI